MFLKKLWLLLSVLLVCTVSGWSKLSDNQKLTQHAYALLKSTKVSYSKKKEAVATLRDIWERDKDLVIIDSIINLLTYTFDRDHFREDDQTMYYGDQIAKSLIDLISEIRTPKAFRILTIYVSKRNHTDATIRAAWKAIQNIDWSQEKRRKEDEK